MNAIQIPSIILPVILPPLYPRGTEVELVANALTHVSVEIGAIAGSNSSTLEPLYEKTAFIFAQEMVVAGVPGNLIIWVEESAYLSVVTPLYWGAIGGGGGFYPPVAFDTIVGTGVDAAIHILPIHWNGYSPYNRLVVQTPIPAVAAGWAVQIVFAAQGR